MICLKNWFMECELICRFADGDAVALCIAVNVEALLTNVELPRVIEIFGAEHEFADGFAIERLQLVAEVFASDFCKVILAYHSGVGEGDREVIVAGERARY